MPVILLNNNKSAFESQYFDALPLAVVQHLGAPPTSLKGNGTLSDDDIRNLTGAPSGSVIAYDMKAARVAGVDLPPAGLYFTVRHPPLIGGWHEIGLCRVPSGHMVYLKDIHIPSTAPAGMGRVILARIARFCIQNGISTIQLMAAGGRTWPHMNAHNVPPAKPLRWWGHYVWARCGFDMLLASSPSALADRALRQQFSYYPGLLASCATVSDVVSKDGGADWWKICGDGWFMAFDSSTANSKSVITLEAYLGERSL